MENTWCMAWETHVEPPIIPSVSSDHLHEHLSIGTGVTHPGIHRQLKRTGLDSQSILWYSECKIPQCTRILQKGDINLYRKLRELSNDSGILHLADKVSPTFRTQAKGVKNAAVTQWRTTTTLCPVHIWAEIIIQLDSYSGTTRDTPLNTVWVERHKTTINSKTTTSSLRAGTLSFGEERLGFSHKEVGTHSIRSGFAMELYLAKVYPETMMIIGR